MAKLGSDLHPAHVQVSSFKRAHEIVDFCDKHQWKVMTHVIPHEPENLSQIKIMIRQAFLPEAFFQKTGRNEPCPCGSQIKFKKCCIDKVI